MPVKVSSTLIRKIYETGHNSRFITNRTGAVHVVYLDVSLKLKAFLAQHTACRIIMYFHFHSVANSGHIVTVYSGQIYSL